MTGLNIINSMLGTTNKTISSAATVAAAIITPCWPIQRRANPIVVCRVNCIDSIQLCMHHEFPYSVVRGYRDYRDNFRIV